MRYFIVMCRVETLALCPMCVDGGVIEIQYRFGRCSRSTVFKVLQTSFFDGRLILEKSLSGAELVNVLTAGHWRT